jgi:oligopeptide transport system substrate-binding protein
LFRGTYTATLFKSLYEGLTRINLDGKVELALAKKIELSKCKTKYIIYLRSSKWANGKKLTASHFVEAWKLAIKPNTKCVQPYRFFPIKNAEKIFQGKLSIEKIGLFAPRKDKIVIYLEHLTPYFTQLLADPIYSPMYDFLDNNNYIFNGSFVIEKFQPGEELQLKKNISFWDVENVKLDGVKISFIRNISIVYELYKKGKLDFIGSPFSDFSVEIIEEVKNLNKKEVCAIHWLHVNTKHPKLSSKSIRKALSLAIDRDYIANEIILNANPNSLILPSKLSQLSTLKKIKKARELFKEGLLELGCKVEDFVITLSYSYLICF